MSKLNDFRDDRTIGQLEEKRTRSKRTDAERDRATAGGATMASASMKPPQDSLHLVHGRVEGLKLAVAPGFNLFMTLDVRLTRGDIAQNPRGEIVPSGLGIYRSASE